MEPEATEVTDASAMQATMKRMEYEIAQSERAYQYLSKGFLHSHGGRVSKTEEADEPYWLDRMEVVARRIAGRDRAATQLVRRETFGVPAVRYVHQFTSLGEAIMMIFREAIPLIERMYPGCCREDRASLYATDTKAVAAQGSDEESEELAVAFNPYISVMLRACQKAMPVVTWHLQDPLAAGEASVRKALDRLLRFVRRVCRSRKFRYDENNFTRNEKENLRSYCKFMASKFAEHSKLLILRVDLYITPERRQWMSKANSDKCMQRVLRALREGRIVPDLKAWICKRENGISRGIHCHVLVAICGHKHHQAGTYSRLLGEAWKLRFSDQCGSYFNCWARRHQYRLNCLGSVHISDREMLMGLREAIRYMTKGSCQVQTGFKRNLFRSNDPRPKRASKRGAPRKAEHDMSLVNEILVGA